MTKPNKIELLVFFTALAIALTWLYYLAPSITGFVIKESSYADSPNLIVTSSYNYTWQPSSIGDLKYIKLDGKITNYGKARVYLESNGVRYLIFDSSNLKINVSAPKTNLITGFSVKNNADESDSANGNNKKKNKKPEWGGTLEFVINGTASINLSQYFIDKDDNLLIYAASDVDGVSTSINNEIITIKPTFNEDFNTTITFTASDGTDSRSQTVNLIVIINQSSNQSSQTSNLTLPISNINETANATSEINKTINVNLSYNPGTVYDANDDGQESVDGVIDFSVGNTKFNWGVDESKLCTRWEVYDVEKDSLTRFCNGNEACCGFVGLLPRNSNWSNIYYSAFNKDGAGYNNIIASQIIYYDVNLSVGNPKSDVYYSEWGNLSAKFFEEETNFFDECSETCTLNGLNKSSYTLIFEIEDNAVLRIDKIKYGLVANARNNPPLLLQNLSTISIAKNKNATIDLSKYFADTDGDTLAYDYYKDGNITIIFENNIATIVPGENAEGLIFTFITANDSEYAIASNVFMINLSEENAANVRFFEVTNQQNESIAVFDSLGNLKIKGFLKQTVEPIADENDFGIANSSLGLNAVIKNPEGDMLIKGTLNENKSVLIPTPNSFIIEDGANEVVSYIDSTGSLFLKGILTENATNNN